MTEVRKRSLRNLAAMALSGTSEVADAGLVLSHSLDQMRLSVDTLVRSIELGGFDPTEVQGHLIGLQHRLEALENFSDECLSVSFLPLEDDDGSETAVAS